MAKMTTAESERYYFEMFREAYGWSGTSVEYGDKPDVIVEASGKKIGIEITNFFLKAGNLPKSEQKQRLARQKVIQHAHKIYLGQKGRTFELTFTFDERHPILEQGKLANAIVALARRAEGGQTGQLASGLLEEIPELACVWLNAKDYDDAKWRIAQVYDVPIMSLPDLKAIIDEKELKATQYKACDAYWLLVIVDFIDAAQDQEIPDDVFKNLQSPVFEKVLLYKPQFGQIVETIPDRK
jgi:hypothetical protein